MTKGTFDWSIERSIEQREEKKNDSWWTIHVKSRQFGIPEKVRRFPTMFGIPETVWHSPRKFPDFQECSEFPERVHDPQEWFKSATILERLLVISTFSEVRLLSMFRRINKVSALLLTIRWTCNVHVSVTWWYQQSKPSCSHLIVQNRKILLSPFGIRFSILK